MDEQAAEDWRQMEEQLTDGEKAEKEEKKFPGFCLGGEECGNGVTVTEWLQSCSLNTGGCFYMIETIVALRKYQFIFFIFGWKHIVGIGIF